MEFCHKGKVGTLWIGVGVWSKSPWVNALQFRGGVGTKNPTHPISPNPTPPWWGFHDPPHHTTPHHDVDFMTHPTTPTPTMMQISWPTPPHYDVDFMIHPTMMGISWATPPHPYHHDADFMTHPTPLWCGFYPTPTHHYIDFMAHPTIMWISWPMKWPMTHPKQLLPVIGQWTVFKNDHNRNVYSSYLVQTMVYCR